MPSFTLPIGPQHPALKEPESFMFKVEGEKVIDASVRIGYVHRGIEKGFENRTFLQGTYLSERICGICSNNHTFAYVNTVESAAEIEAPPKAQYLRVIIGELERIHSHLLWLGIGAHEIGFDTLFMYSWRDRELVLDLFEEITGNRVNHGSNAIGGVRFDLTPKMKESVKNGAKTVRERTEYYIDLALKDKTIAMRSKGVGFLSTDKANELCAVGPTLRSSNVALDIRKNDPYGAYKEIPFNVIKHDTCDVFARVVVRLKEIIESCNIIDYAVDNLPNGPLKVNVPKRIPVGEYVSSVEAPRGELVYYVKSTGRDNPYRVKVRTPTLANITSIREAVLGENIADIPIIVAGIDPCFACQDRSLFIDTERNKRWIWNKEELRNYGIKWYKKQL